MELELSRITIRSDFYGSYLIKRTVDLALIIYWNNLEFIWGQEPEAFWGKEYLSKNLKSSKNSTRQLQLTCVRYFMKTNIMELKTKYLHWNADGLVMTTILSQTCKVIFSVFSFVQVEMKS